MWLFSGLRATLSGDALRHDSPSAGAAFGPQIDDPVRFRHDVEIVFDHDQGIAGIDQPMQYAQQFFHIRHVQSHRGLIEHIKRVLSLAPCDVLPEFVGAHLGKFGDQLDALAFSAGQRRAGLTKGEIA